MSESTRWHTDAGEAQIWDEDERTIVFHVEARIDCRSIVADHNALLGIESPETTVPELVAALAELIEDCAADMQQEFGTHEKPNPTSPALERARAILAKTGKT